MRKYRLYRMTLLKNFIGTVEIEFTCHPNKKGSAWKQTKGVYLLAEKHRKYTYIFNLTIYTLIA